MWGKSGKLAGKPRKTIKIYQKLEKTHENSGKTKKALIFLSFSFEWPLQKRQPTGMGQLNNVILNILFFIN